MDRAAELRLLEGVDAFCASVQGALEEPSFEVQQKVIQLVVNRIVVEDSRVPIEQVVPTGPVRLQPEHQRDQNLKAHCQGETFPTTLLFGKVCARSNQHVKELYRVAPGEPCIVFGKVSNNLTARV
jgi:hypothetical protein